jgi:arginyl-tRNA--protein-N-Asp/Glu arginylyltransferase
MTQSKDAHTNQSETQLLEFYATPEHDCPYLENKKSKTLFLNPEVETNDIIYDFLIDKGFRRSGEHIYRPHCDDCKACISTKIVVNDYQPNKQQKRCFKKGARFTTKIHPASFDETHYQLFERYINIRHKDGDMYPTSVKQYKDFILDDSMNTQFLDFIEPTTGQLIACLVFDELASGLSAIYTFFDPDYSKFSPGRLAVITLIEYAKQLNLNNIYLGYWIKDCQKMSYKGEYRPIECFVEDSWVKLS